MQSLRQLPRIRSPPDQVTPERQASPEARQAVCPRENVARLLRAPGGARTRPSTLGEAAGSARHGSRCQSQDCGLAGQGGPGDARGGGWLGCAESSNEGIHRLEGCVRGRRYRRAGIHSLVGTAAVPAITRPMIEERGDRDSNQSLLHPVLPFPLNSRLFTHPPPSPLRLGTSLRYFRP